MEKRILICILVIFLASLFFLTSVIENFPPNKKKTKNVIIIVIDAVRADHLNCYGYERNTTPYICEFFEKGIKYKNARSQATQTTPSHASLFTSRWPFEFRTRGINDTHVDRYRKELKFLAEILKSKGYHTAGFYGVPLEPWHTVDQGFEISIRGHQSFKEKINQSLRYMERNKGEKKFLFLHTLIVHEPYEMKNGSAFPVEHPRSEGTDYLNRTALKEYNLNETEIREITRRIYWQKNPQKIPFTDTISVSYQGKRYTFRVNNSLGKMIEAYDYGLKRADRKLKGFLENLERRGMMNNSLIIVTSDHGEAFMEHGLFAHQEGCRIEQNHIPLFIKGPSIDQGVVDKRVRLIDIVPTVLDYLNIESPQSFDGESLLPAENIVKDRSVWTVTPTRNKICFWEGNRSIYYESRNQIMKVYNSAKDPYQIRPIKVMEGREVKVSSFGEKIMEKERKYNELPREIVHENITKDERRKMEETLRDLGYFR